MPTDSGDPDARRDVHDAALGETLGISDVAVSKTLRNVERKLLTDAISATGAR
ncbi:helix-turn-helix domain-containing protein [Salinigranum rubrum]|uniref:helix-turn-helix domain-containing protein n=1 Tax=Salinigranum rubrum TaxID=755307 RepID=UPI003744A22D